MASPVLLVPSVIIGTEWNAVINPLHPEFPALAIGAPEILEVDPRLRRRG